MRNTRSGAIVALVGFLLIFVGLFSGIGRCAVPGAPCPEPGPDEIAAYLGLALLTVGIVLLVRAGWRGSAAAWVLAAVAVVPVVWFIYELLRQGICPMLADRPAQQACLEAYGELTAPVLSYTAAAVVLVVVLVRRRRLRSASGG